MIAILTATLLNIYSSPFARITANRTVTATQDTIYDLVIDSKMKLPISTVIIGEHQIKGIENLSFKKEPILLQKNGWKSEIDSTEESNHVTLFWQTDLGVGIQPNTTESAFQILVSKGNKTNLGNCYFTLIDDNEQRYCSKVSLNAKIATLNSDTTTSTPPDTVKPPPPVSIDTAVTDTTKIPPIILPGNNDSSKWQALALMMEDPQQWKSNSCMTATQSNDHIQGNNSLSFMPNDYCEYYTENIVKSNQSTYSTLTMAVKISALQANKDWYGDIQAYIESPKSGIYSGYLGRIALTGISVSTWKTLSISIPGAIKDKINSVSGDDFKLTLSINTPKGSGPLLIDDIKFIAP